MERQQFEHVKSQMNAATAAQVLELEDFVQHFASRQVTEMALARRTRQTLGTRICPHCQSNDILLHGKDQNGRQRFKCRLCRRTYNILTGTPMARARKPEKWGQYLGCMTEHMSVRKIVACGIGLHQVTVWRWRHRFLAAAANDSADIVSGVVEADTTFFRRSTKGSRDGDKGKPVGGGDRSRRAGDAAKGLMSPDQVPVLTVLDSCGRVFDTILASLSEIEAALLGRVAAGSVLCSDDSSAYANVADKAGAEHHVVCVPVATRQAVETDPVAPPGRQPGRLGLRRVHHYHQRLKYLINERCRGVATKYLGNYLGWHRAMTRPGFEGKSLLAKALA